VKGFVEEWVVNERLEKEEKGGRQEVNTGRKV
jgi:hypothetical protein